jgi:hypothetical protein
MPPRNLNRRKTKRRRRDGYNEYIDYIVQILFQANLGAIPNVETLNNYIHSLSRSVPELTKSIRQIGQNFNIDVYETNNYQNVVLYPVLQKYNNRWMKLYGQEPSYQQPTASNRLADAFSNWRRGTRRRPLTGISSAPTFSASASSAAAPSYSRMPSPVSPKSATATTSIIASATTPIIASATTPIIAAALTPIIAAATSLPRRPLPPFPKPAAATTPINASALSRSRGPPPQSLENSSSQQNNYVSMFRDNYGDIDRDKIQVNNKYGHQLILGKGVPFTFNSQPASILNINYDYKTGIFKSVFLHLGSDKHLQEIYTDDERWNHVILTSVPVLRQPEVIEENQIEENQYSTLVFDQKTPFLGSNNRIYYYSDPTKDNEITWNTEVDFEEAPPNYKSKPKKTVIFVQGGAQKNKNNKNTKKTK